MENYICSPRNNNHNNILNQVDASKPINTDYLLNCNKYIVHSYLHVYQLYTNYILVKHIQDEGVYNKRKCSLNGY